VEMSKKTIRLDLPMQIGCFVYQYGKLRMLEFYYDFMDVFVDRRDFQYCAMDTDSAYMALPAASLEEVIKPDMQQRYQMEKKNWFTRTDTPQFAAYDNRTPGLFKTEFTGDGMIALCSKTYFCFGAEDKFGCKVVNRKSNNVTKEKYMDVLLTKQSGSGTNRGFVPLITYRKELGSPTSTQIGKSWQIGPLQHHWRFEVRGIPAVCCIYIVVENKEKKVKATPNYILVLRTRSHLKIQIENFGKKCFLIILSTFPLHVS